MGVDSLTPTEAKLMQGSRSTNVDFILLTYIISKEKNFDRAIEKFGMNASLGVLAKTLQNLAICLMQNQTGNERSPIKKNREGRQYYKNNDLSDSKDIRHRNKSKS